MNQPAHSREGRTYLDVPYNDKDAAKALGARWDQTARRWYDPQRTTPGLQRWAARPDVPDLLPGEDRTFGQGLFVDMVPSSCWFTNVRTCVSPQDWERLRRMITRRAGQRCEICGASEDRSVQRWLEAHERWAYDDAAGVQTLRRLICLCSDCHLSTHLGYANVTGRADQALTHLRAVTGSTDTQIGQHVRDANQLWTDRSRRVWRLDLSMLTSAGVTLARPDAPVTRLNLAEQRLRATEPAVEMPRPRPAPKTQPPAPSATSRPELVAETREERSLAASIKKFLLRQSGRR
jgi:Domain of unknown function (DUF5710)